MRVVLIAFCFSMTIVSYGQGDITIEKGSLGGTRFIYEGQTIKPKAVLTLMESDEQAYPVFKKAMSNYNAGQVLGFIGGFMVGWPLGTAIAGGDPQWGLAAGGAAIILCTIPLSVAFNKHAKTAVSIYNKQPMAFKPKFTLSAHGMGAKVTMKF